MPDSNSNSRNHTDQLVEAFAHLEKKYQEWFALNKASIVHSFIDEDYNNDFIAECKLPEHIKVECALIKFKFEHATHFNED